MDTVDHLQMDIAQSQAIHKREMALARAESIRDIDKAIKELRVMVKKLRHLTDSLVGPDFEGVKREFGVASGELEELNVDIARRLGIPS